MKIVFSAVKALIKNQNKFLMVRLVINGKEVWDLPGGRITHGETPSEALRREIREELNSEIEIKKHFGIYWFYRLIDQNQVICNTFLCKLKEGSININLNPSETEDIKEFRWLTKQEMIEKRASDNSFKEMIKGL